MKAIETILCINGSAKQSVPGGGRGSSNKSDPAKAGNGKAPVWYHKHCRPVNHTSYPIQLYESALLGSRLIAMRRDMMYAVSLHPMMHVYRCLSTT
jgi:hypothetical protein